MELLYYLLLTLFSLFIVKLLSQTNKNKPPGPAALPLLGHLHLFKKSINRTLQNLSNKYSPILFLRFGSRTVVVVSSQSLVEECFTKKDIIFANRPHLIVGDQLSYNYTVVVWSPYGYHWRNMRRITTIDIFSSKSLQLSSNIRKNEIDRLISHLYRSSKGRSQLFEMKFMFSKLMFDVVTRMVTGNRCFEESMDLDEQKKIYSHLKEIFAPVPIFCIGDFLPFLRWSGLYSEEKRLTKLHKERDSLLQDMINDYRRNKNASCINLIADKKTKSTIIDALLSIQNTEPEEYSDDFIKGIILIMFTAGIETTSLTMEWALSLLLNHPDILRKTRSEIDNHVQGRLLNDSDLANLPYLHCVINETLRLYPAAPLLVPHASSEACTIGGYDIPRGAILFANIWAIHRDPKVWVEPTKFMPERFEGVRSEKEMGSKFAPFGLGRRGCPGASLAMRMVALGLGTLIQSFEWERLGEDQVDMNEANNGVTVTKAQPLVAACKPRLSMVEALSQIELSNTT